MINLIFVFVSLFAFGQTSKIKISPSKIICTDMLIKNGKGSADPKKVVELLKPFFPNPSPIQIKSGGRIEFQFDDNSFQLFASQNETLNFSMTVEPVANRFPAEKYGSFFIVPGRTKITVIESTPNHLELICEFKEKLYDTYTSKLILDKTEAGTYLIIETKKDKPKYFGKNRHFDKYYQWRSKFFSNPLRFYF